MCCWGWGGGGGGAPPRAGPPNKKKKQHTHHKKRKKKKKKKKKTNREPTKKPTPQQFSKRLNKTMKANKCIPRLIKVAMKISNFRNYVSYYIYKALKGLIFNNSKNWRTIMQRWESEGPVEISCRISPKRIRRKSRPPRVAINCGRVSPRAIFSLPSVSGLLWTLTGRWKLCGLGPV